jgi:hypothetical protein
MSNLLEKASIILTPTAYSDGTLHSIKPLQTFGSELITNGDGSSTTGWSVAYANTTLSINNNNLRATANSSGAYGLSQSLSLDTTKKYIITASINVDNASGGTANLRLATNANLGTNITTLSTATGTTTTTFTPTASTMYIGIVDTANSSSNYVEIDNISVKEVTNADFDFTRPTTGSATGIGSRENSSGNIESVAANLPRIDYLGGTGHILLEPQSTNKYTYSQDFSQVYWNKTNATVSTSTITDPAGGQNSFKLVPDSGTGGNRSLGRNFTGLSGLHTQTVFAKKGEYNYIILRTRNAPQTGVMFDLENGTFNVNLTSAAFDSAKIEDYGNGWFRCSMTLDPSQMTVSGQIFTSFSVGITGSETNNFDGDGTSGIYIFGAQFEELSFPTSYIPTSESTVTRSQDKANNSGSSDLISSTEGVLYGEIAALADDQTRRDISISDGSNENTIRFHYQNAVSNTIRFQIRAANTITASSSFSVTDIKDFHKVAISYKLNDVKFFIDGVKVGTDAFAAMPTGLNQLSFYQGAASQNFFGKVKCVAVFKEALTDAELTCLTS